MGRGRAPPLRRCGLQRAPAPRRPTLGVPPHLPRAASASPARPGRPPARLQPPPLLGITGLGSVRCWEAHVRPAARRQLRGARRARPAASAGALPRRTYCWIFYYASRPGSGAQAGAGSPDRCVNILRAIYRAETLSTCVWFRGRRPETLGSNGAFTGKKALLALALATARPRPPQPEDCAPLLCHACRAPSCACRMGFNI
jgi:hypothetical protein